jgi:hypothetical protein
MKLYKRKQTQSQKRETATEIAGWWLQERMPTLSLGKEGLLTVLIRTLICIPGKEICQLMNSVLGRVSWLRLRQGAVATTLSLSKAHQNGGSCSESLLSSTVLYNWAHWVMPTNASLQPSICLAWCLTCSKGPILASLLTKPCLLSCGIRVHGIDLSAMSQGTHG